MDDKLWMPESIDDDLALFEEATADLGSCSSDTITDFITGLRAWTMRLVDDIDKTLVEARRYGTIHLQSPCDPDNRAKNAELILRFSKTAEGAATKTSGSTIIVPNVVDNVEESITTFYNKRAKAIVRHANIHLAIVEWLGFSGNIIPTELTTVDHVLYTLGGKLKELADFFRAPHHTQTTTNNARNIAYTISRMCLIVYETFKEIEDLINEYTPNGFICPSELKGL